jgi:predicted Fe-Mo cluster-binding NifX family protein
MRSRLVVRPRSPHPPGVDGNRTSWRPVEGKDLDLQANYTLSQSGGAGIQAAQFVVNQGAEVVLSGNLGPNAFDVLQAAGVPGYLVSEGTVRQAVEAYRAGQLQPMGGPNVSAHAGMRGAGRGMGRGPQTTASSKPDVEKDRELGELRETLKGLRQQLAETMEKIEGLEKEG